MRGSKLCRALQVLLRLGKPSLAERNVAKLRQAEIIIRIQLQFAMKLLHRLGKSNLSLTQQIRRSQTVVRLGQARIERNGFFEFNDGKVGIACLGVGPAKVQMDRRLIAKAADISLKTLVRILRFGQRKIGRRQRQSILVVWIERNGGLQLLARLLVLHPSAAAPRPESIAPLHSSVRLQPRPAPETSLSVYRAPARAV